MTSTTGDRTFGAMVAWRLTGQARIDRYVREQGRVLNLTLSAALFAGLMVAQGFVLLPGGSEPLVAFPAVLARVAPAAAWGWFAVAVGAAQVGGIALAWLGLVPPVRRLRILASACTLFYFISIGLAQFAAGATFGPPVYIAVAVLAARDLANAGSAH